MTKQIPKKVLPKQKKGEPSKKPVISQKKEFESNRYFDIYGLAIIILLGIIIYANSFDCSFHFDDQQNIQNYSKIRSLDNIKSLWEHGPSRFIPYVTFAINYHFDKLNVWGYHLFNLVIHLINACLVWWLTLLIFSTPNIKNYSIVKHKKVIALLTGLLFVSHPLATQSVVYIVQRLASMAALFYLLSLALYVKARLSDKNSSLKYLLYTGSFISAVAAMLSKENAYTLPFAILLFEIFFLQTKRLKVNFKDSKVYILMALFIGFIIFVVTKFSFNVLKPLIPDEHNDFNAITSSDYLFTQFAVITKYIQLLFLPINQNLDYDIPISKSLFSPVTFLSFLFLLSLVGLAIFLFKKNRIVSFGICWFFLTLLIESSIIPISDVMFEHRTYLPSFGFFLILSTGVYTLLWNKNKSLAMTIFILIIISNSYLTIQRNKVWKDDETLWSDVVSKSPNKPRPYNNLGKYFMDTDKNEEAITNFSKAIELRPAYSVPYYNRGIIYGKENKLTLAMTDYNKAIELDPKYTDAFNNRGNLFKLLNRYDEALKDYDNALNLRPKYAECLMSRGGTYDALKKYDAAQSDYSKAISLKPDAYSFYMIRGIFYENERKMHEEALKDFNKAIEIKPDFAEAYLNRGVVEINTRKKDEACSDFKKSEALGNHQGTAMYNKYCN